MTTGTGIDAQFGMVDEVTYGTPVTVTRFLEFQNEGVVLDLQRMESYGLGAGAFQRASHIEHKIIGAKGPITFHVMDLGFGLLLKHCFGDVTSANVTTGVNTHTFGLDTDLLRGLSATMQFGKPSLDGTVQPYTFHGCKILSAELSAEFGGPLMLTVEVDSEDVETGVALASASFASSRTPFWYSDATVLTLNSSNVYPKKVSVKITNNLSTDRHHAASRLKRQPLGNTPPVVDITLDGAEFEDLNAYNDMVAGTARAFAWTIEGSTISGAHKFGVNTTAGKAVIIGDAPKVDGPGPLPFPLKLRAYWDGTNSPLALVYKTSDAAP